MEMPLGRMATDADRYQACYELDTALGSPNAAIGRPYDWLHDDLGRAELFQLMIDHQIFPSRKAYDEQDYIAIRWGNLTSQTRVVPITEHESEADATAFCIVLAVTSKLESGG